MAVPVEALEGRLASLPEGVRIEVRFSGATEAVARLYALVQVLTNDYDRFETLVGRGEVGIDPEAAPGIECPRTGTMNEGNDEHVARRTEWGHRVT